MAEKFLQDGILTKETHQVVISLAPPLVISEALTEQSKRLRKYLLKLNKHSDILIPFQNANVSVGADLLWLTSTFYFAL